MPRSMGRALLALLLSAPLTALAGQSLVLSDAWIPEAPPVAPVQAGYVHIHNPGSEAVTIVAVRSPDFGRIEMHQTRMEDGVARMIPLDSLAVGAGKTRELSPGGLHLMLFEPARPLRAGDSVELIFELADGSEVRTKAEVRTRGHAGGHMHGHGGH